MQLRHDISGRFRLVCETIVIWLAPCLTPVFHCARKTAINDGGRGPKNPDLDARYGKTDARRPSLFRVRLRPYGGSYC